MTFKMNNYCFHTHPLNGHEVSINTTLHSPFSQTFRHLIRVCFSLITGKVRDDFSCNFNSVPLKSSLCHCSPYTIMRDGHNICFAYILQRIFFMTFWLSVRRSETTFLHKFFLTAMIRIDFESTKMHSFAVLFSECYGFLLGVKILKLLI